MSTTLLRASANLLLSGGTLRTAASSYPAYSVQPTPGYALGRETPLASAKVLYTLPGMSATTVATLFLVVNKASAIEDLRMMCSIITAPDDGTRTWLGYTGRGYYYNGGVTVNTYQASFLSMENPAVLDNERTVLLTARFGANGLFFYLNGVLQQSVAYNGGPLPRPWSDQFMLGGEPSSATYDWQGLISACYVYLSDLSDVDRARTERYLLASYPAIS